jgi:hypothetical protein
MDKIVKVVYDITSTPEGLDIQNMVKIFENHHVVFWDSGKGGLKPSLYESDRKLPTLIVDTKGQELDIEKYSKEFAEQEFWDKELHRCQSSPMYLFSNYLTSEYPHTSAKLKVYLESIGATAIEAKNEEEAQKLWKEQQVRVKKALSTLTKEELMEHKKRIDILKFNYEDRMAKLEAALSPGFVRLTKPNNEPLTVLKKKANIVTKIRKILPVPKKWSDTYRNKKGVWDSPILFATEYHVLINIFYDILRSTDRIEDVLDSPTK